MPVLDPQISILLPTYNGARYLSAQIDSILGQRFERFELVIVDDGSSDNTPSISAGYARRDARVRVLPADGNAGQKLRLLQLVQEARASLISFADQDDVWDRERTDRLHAALGDAVMSFGRSELVDAAGTPLGQTLIGQFGPEPTPRDRLTLLFRPRVSAHAMLVRREAVTELAFRRYQPFDWLLALDAAFSGGLVYVDDAVIHHRIHGGNQSNARAGHRSPLRQRLRPGPVFLELQRPRTARAILVELLEHLGNSPVIPPPTARALLQLGLRCRAEWLVPGSGRPYDNPVLARFLLEGLRPFAGSDADLQIARDDIEDMTKSRLHPRSLRRTAANVLR